MSDIFISYFHHDRPHAEALARALEAEGLSVWWDRTIPAGCNFDQVIEEALNAAKVVMVLWSRGSVQSRWVLNEAEEAAARSILVPVFIEETILSLPRILINGGRRGYLVGLDPQVCVRLLHAKPVNCALAE